MSNVLFLRCTSKCGTSVPIALTYTDTVVIQDIKTSEEFDLSLGAITKESNCISHIHGRRRRNRETPQVEDVVNRGTPVITPLQHFLQYKYITHHTWSMMYCVSFLHCCSTGSDVILPLTVFLFIVLLWHWPVCIQSICCTESYVWTVMVYFGIQNTLSSHNVHFCEEFTNDLSILKSSPKSTSAVHCLCFGKNFDSFLFTLLYQENHMC